MIFHKCLVANISPGKEKSSLLTVQSVRESPNLGTVSNDRLVWSAYLKNFTFEFIFWTRFSNRRGEYFSFPIITSNFCRENFFRKIFRITNQEFSEKKIGRFSNFNKLVGENFSWQSDVGDNIMITALVCCRKIDVASGSYLKVTSIFRKNLIS